MIVINKFCCSIYKKGYKHNQECGIKKMDMSVKLWDFWADRYSKLWVQKVSLGPTRDYVLREIKEIAHGRKLQLLDLGCGPGELLTELGENCPQLALTGVDYSPRMLELSQQRNRNTKHILLDAADLDKLESRYDIIVCTHSLPYYRDPKDVFRNLSRLLTENGRLIVGFASGNSIYDKAVLSGVKLTTGRAHYPSNREFVGLVKEYFQVHKLKIIKKRAFYMPRIAVYTLGKTIDTTMDKTIETTMDKTMSKKLGNTLDKTTDKTMTKTMEKAMDKTLSKTTDMTMDSRECC